MTPLCKWIGHGLLFGVLLAGLPGPVQAGDQDPDHPPGWKVKVLRQGMSARQSVYRYHVQVRDEAGRGVEDAEVFLRAPGPSGWRLVRAQRIKPGWYAAKVHLPLGVHNPRDVEAVVRR